MRPGRNKRHHEAGEALRRLDRWVSTLAVRWKAEKERRRLARNRYAGPPYSAPFDHAFHRRSAAHKPPIPTSTMLTWSRGRLRR